MIVKLYDRVRLNDGRICTIVDILEEDMAYIVDVDLPGPDWETTEIHHEDIAEVIK